MAERIVFPDTEDAVRRHLKALAGSGVTVTAGVKPAKLGTTHIHAWRTGGVLRSLVVDAPQITVECYASTSKAAHDLAQWVRSELAAAARTQTLADVTLYSVDELAGPYLDPDPDATGVHRYSATYVLAVRGHAT